MLKSFVEKTPCHGEFFERVFLEISGRKLQYKKILRDQNGKPQAISGWYFSVTHSGPFCAVAFSRDSDVGTDLERIENTVKMSSRVLNKILAQNEKPVNGNYLNNFVIKEAVSKLTGEGLSMGFSRYDANDLIKKYRATDLSNAEYVWWILQGSNL